ncbi:MAG: hypothetical protein ABJB66_18635 [Gemmatimonadaceae bacterium]
MNYLCTAFAAALIATVGCKDNPTASAPATATVRFTITSPFCGPNSYTIDFAADSIALGTEAIKDKGTSKTYTVSTGRHVLGAYIQNWHLSFDTTVTLTAGQTLVRDINLYCS